MNRVSNFCVHTNQCSFLLTHIHGGLKNNVAWTNDGLWIFEGRMKEPKLTDVFSEHCNSKDWFVRWELWMIQKPTKWPRAQTRTCDHIWLPLPLSCIIQSLLPTSVWSGLLHTRPSSSLDSTSCCPRSLRCQNNQNLHRSRIEGDRRTVIGCSVCSRQFSVDWNGQK